MPLIPGSWSWGETPWGQVLIHWAQTALHLMVFEESDLRVPTLRVQYPEFSWEDQESALPPDLQKALQAGTLPTPWTLEPPGTDFQQKVWARLRAIPRGQVTTYGDLARELGSPGASRAVGTAVGANPIAVFIPCHRVLRSDGGLGGYRWGLERKKALLRSEGIQG